MNANEYSNRIILQIESMLTAFFLCVVKIKWTDVTLHAQELNSVNLLEYG